MKVDVHALFLKSAPVAVLSQTCLERLFDPDRLDRLFEASAVTQYSRSILFSDLCHIMLFVAFGLKKSVLDSYRAHREELGVSHQAFYTKLARTDDAVSEALVTDSAEQIRPVMRALKATRPEPIHGYRTRVVDGNLLTGVERRVKELRTTWARGLPGRCLVVYEPAVDLVTHVFLTRDAHSGERERLSEVLALIEPNDLMLLDSLYCTHETLRGCHARRAVFIVRHHSVMTGRPQGQRVECGRIANGTVYEQALEMRDPNQGWCLRRITLVLDQPTRDGHTEIHLLSNIPPSRAKATQLAEAYRDRWTIESRFYEMAQTLNVEPGTLGYPPAALFLFCLGLVASNAAALVRASLQAVHGVEQVESMSKHYMAEEIRQTQRGWAIATQGIAPEHDKRHTPTQFARVLKSIARHVIPGNYRKTPRGPKKQPPKKRKSQNGINLSIQRLLDDR